MWLCSLPRRITVSPIKGELGHVFPKFSGQKGEYVAKFPVWGLWISSDGGSAVDNWLGLTAECGRCDLTGRAFREKCFARAASGRCDETSLTVTVEAMASGSATTRRSSSG